MGVGTYTDGGGGLEPGVYVQDGEAGAFGVDQVLANIVGVVSDQVVGLVTGVGNVQVLSKGLEVQDVSVVASVVGVQVVSAPQVVSVP